MGPHIRAGPCWEGIWAALLAGRECVQGPPITALAWGVKQIDWQASGGQFQTAVSIHPNTEFRVLCSKPAERPEADAGGM